MAETLIMTSVHEHYNFTSFITDYVLSRAGDGANQIICILKAGFGFDADGSISVLSHDRMLPIFRTDKYYDIPENSGVRYPSDVTPEKNGTDIVINGHAYGYGQNRVSCGFKLGHMSKKLIVTGHRVWNRILSFYKITGPFPFVQIPLLYENAFGGRYEDNKGVLHQYALNPVGKGFGAKHLDRPLLPHIEYGKERVRSIHDKPKPAGFGAIPLSWPQRLVHAGTFDDAWKKDRFPLPPVDLNPRYYNAVPEDQIFRPKLKGSEKLILFNLHQSNPELKLVIPKQTFTCTVRIKQDVYAKPMDMDTCLIEPDEHRLTLTYACRFPLESDIKYLKSVQFES